MNKYLLALLVGASLSACKVERDDEPLLVDELNFAWTLTGGLKDGVLTTVHTNSGDRDPTVVFELVTDSWLESGGTEGGSCNMTYKVTSEPVDVDSTFQAFEMTFLEGTTDCVLDETEWGEDPTQRFASWTWSHSIEAYDSDIAEFISGYLGDQWETFKDNYFGSRIWIDGEGYSWDGMVFYGRAFSVDDEMNIFNEDNGGMLLGSEALEQGSDGYYEFYPTLYFGF